MRSVEVVQGANKLRFPLDCRCVGADGSGRQRDSKKDQLLPKWRVRSGLEGPDKQLFSIRVCCDSANQLVWVDVGQLSCIAKNSARSSASPRRHLVHGGLDTGLHRGYCTHGAGAK